MSDKSLRKVIKLFGSQARVAEELAVSKKTVNGWLNQFKQMPLQHALQLEELTGGKILAEELIPHLKERIQRFRSYVINKHLGS